MNIDERLDKLAERTEAIAQSVELLASFQRDSEKRSDERMARVDHVLELLAAAQRNAEQKMVQLAESTIHLDEGMARVVNILVNHEGRISDIEGNRTP